MTKTSVVWLPFIPVAGSRQTKARYTYCIHIPCFSFIRVAKNMLLLRRVCMLLFKCELHFTRLARCQVVYLCCVRPRSMANNE